MGYNCNMVFKKWILSTIDKLFVQMLKNGYEMEFDKED